MMETESIINGLLYSMLIMNVFELTDHLKWFRGALVSGDQNLVAILYVGIGVPKARRKRDISGL